ncbi:MAG TPA: permease [Sphingomonas sp.]|nr:permease [Sphingomonas sp.]
MALYLMLGFSAGLPLYMFSTVLALRLARHGVGLVTIGFFAWVALLPTFKFTWAPFVDRCVVPGFGAFWGKRRGWIMLAQLGIFASMAAMAFTAADRSLPLTALFAVLLAFWTTTLEIAADAWRIELAPTKELQGPIVAASLWGYRAAMVAAGSVALLIADNAGWTWAYLTIAGAALAPFPIMASMPPSAPHGGRRSAALAIGLVSGVPILLGTGAAVAAIGWLLLRTAGLIGISDRTNVTPAVLIICLLPFAMLALGLPWIRRLPETSRARSSTVTGPYVDLFWRLGYAALPVLAFVSIYRMGDVLTIALSKPLENAAHYSLTQIGWADGWVALPSAIIGVATGGWLAARFHLIWMLAVGAACSAAGNWIFVWLWYQPPSDFAIAIATGLDQFAHGLESAIFVVYLSLLVNPRYPGAQYALLSGFAFLVPRLLAGASGSIQAQIGYSGFFWMSGALSAAAIVFLPFIARVKPRAVPIVAGG